MGPLLNEQHKTTACTNMALSLVADSLYCFVSVYVALSAGHDSGKPQMPRKSGMSPSATFIITTLYSSQVTGGSLMLQLLNYNSPNSSYLPKGGCQKGISDEGRQEYLLG